MSERTSQHTSTMADTVLVDRLAALPKLAKIPRQELEWLVAHGEVKVGDAGRVIGAKGKRVRHLWILISGHMAIHVDRGVGPRLVAEWFAGDVSGMLPYSRMSGPPGDNYLAERSEFLGVHEDHFPEMIHRCPVFTAHTVHIMLDRARDFNTSDLHDEKMVSLGKLAAGLAHELNNPASATARSAQLLRDDLGKLDAASRALAAAGLTGEFYQTIERVRSVCLIPSDGTVKSPLERVDREEEITHWLVRHQADPTYADLLVDTAVTIDVLDRLAAEAAGDTLDAALRWITAWCRAQSLARDIERAGTRIYDLVAAVKKFTFMDKRAELEAVDVEAGLRDTLQVLVGKAKAKETAMTLAIEPRLPHVRATGGDINQVWFSLIDNALDAVSQSGQIEIDARRVLDRVVVRVVDNGPGIAPETMPRIFDAFFTTKPPGENIGLGLELARRIVRRYRGDVSVESRPGRTEFCVSLIMIPSDGE